MFAYTRTLDAEAYLVLLNFGTEPVPYALPGGLRVAAAVLDNGAGDSATAGATQVLLAPWQATVYRLASLQGQLEFHDSEVRSVALEGAALTITFSAAFVQADGAGAGYVQSLVITCTGASVDGPLVDGVGRLSHGKLWVNGVVLPAMPFPYSAPGPVRVELQFSNGTRLAIAAVSLVCRFTGDAKFVESFAC